MADWTCPRCRRRFVRRNARHSCVRRTVTAFFAGRPRPRALFRVVRAAIAALGPVEVEVTRSQIGFRARTRFAWAWMPQQWLTSAPPDALVLTLELDRRVRSPKIKQAVRVRPGRWTHHLVLDDEHGVDAEVLGWLRQARAQADPPRVTDRVGAPRSRTRRRPRRRARATARRSA